MLEPKVKELIYTAFDASATHMYVPGLRQHIENALGYGATPAEVMEVFELASTIGIHGYLVGAADRARGAGARGGRSDGVRGPGREGRGRHRRAAAGSARASPGGSRPRARSVVVVDRDEERAATRRRRAGRRRSRSRPTSREEAASTRYMDAAVERFGRIDLYHLNAGIAGTPVPIPEIEAHEFDEVMAVNVRGVFLGLRDAFRQYERQGSGGAIVTTSSLAGRARRGRHRPVPRLQARRPRPRPLRRDPRRDPRRPRERDRAGDHPDQPDQPAGRRAGDRATPRTSAPG